MNFDDILEKKLDIKFYEFSNCFAFEIENFLSDEQYELIKKNLPNADNEALKKSNKDFYNKELQHNKKIYINELYQKEYQKYVIENPVLNNFSTVIKDPIFAKKLVDNLFLKIISSRKYDYKNFLKLLLRKNKYEYKDNKSLIDKLFYNYFYTTFEIAYMFNGSESWPHTDGIKKMLSLLMYFPDDSDHNEKYNNMGTSFFQSDEFCLTPDQYKIKSFEDSNDFKKRNKLSGSFPYKKKSLFGFLKSHNSWHSVEPFFINKDFVRKNFNINILLI